MNTIPSRVAFVLSFVHEFTRNCCGSAPPSRPSQSRTVLALASIDAPTALQDWLDVFAVQAFLIRRFADVELLISFRLCEHAFVNGTVTSDL